MSRVMIIRIPPALLAKAEKRATQLGLDRGGYVRNLIERDIGPHSQAAKHRFASRDLVGSFRLGGGSATNEAVRRKLRDRVLAKREGNC